MGLGSIFIALMLCLILFSYNPEDPGLFYASGQDNFSNLAGYFGARVASYLYFFLGYGSFFIPIFLILLAVSIIRAKTSQLYIRIIKRLSGLLLVLAICGLLTLRDWQVDVLPSTAGGTLGIIIASNSVNLLGFLGANLFLSGLAIISVSLFSGFSWLQIFEVVGAVVLYIAYKLKLHKMTDLPLLPSKGSVNAMVNASGSVFKKKRVNGRQASRREPQLVYQPGKSDIASRLEKDEEAKALALNAARNSTVAPPPKQTVPTITSLRPKPSEQPSPQQPQDSSPAKSSSADVARSSIGYILPTTDLLSPEGGKTSGVSDEELTIMGETLVNTLLDFGIKADLIGYSPGPVVTRFELEPAAGIKASRISNLANDLSRSLAVGNVRVVEFISGKSCIGVEVPNPSRQMVNFRSLLESPEFNKPSLQLPLALGQDIAGNSIIVDLATMPHILVAGTTGSGKSIGINAMVISLLYKHSPDDLRLIMVDPKMLELASYNDIPNLLTPVITDMNLASKSIGWCVNEMDRRYKLMADFGARNIHSYNQLAEKSRPPDSEKLPYIVLVIDEYADMIMINRKVEDHIVRLAQKARAAGIHIILATQRPSVDVITGLIKANIPARISYKVSSRIDSRTILDQSGAEQLIGKGDMLYMGSGGEMAMRVHGAFVADEDINKVTEHCRKHGKPDYKEEVFQAAAAGEKRSGGEGGEKGDEKDELYEEALAFVRDSQRVSISLVQRKFKIGYNRAARIIEFMEEQGVVSEMDTSGKRSVLG